MANIGRETFMTQSNVSCFKIQERKEGKNVQKPKCEDTNIGDEDISLNETKYNVCKVSSKDNDDNNNNKKKQKKQQQQQKTTNQTNKRTNRKEKKQFGQ